MAANPLFSSYRHYQICNHHSQGFSMSGESDSPPEKRRRTDAEETKMKFEEMWDEDIEFSQADIQSLDVMASQAYLSKEEGNGHEHESVSRRQLTLPVASEFQQPPPRPSTSRLSRKNSSSTSTLSLSKNSSSSTLYPSTISSRHSSDTRSLSSTSSHTSSESGKRDSIPQPASQVSELQAKIATLEKALEKSQAQENLYSKDGEIKILREALKKKDMDLLKMREDRLQSIDQLNIQKTALAESLKTENDKLVTQLQFREQEFKELEEKCRHMEQKLQSASSVSPIKPQSPAIHVSPAKRGQTDSSPLSKSSFPSRQSFMADERAYGEPRPSTSTSAGVALETVTGDTRADKKIDTVPCRVRRCVLNTHMRSGDISGPQLVRYQLQESSVGAQDQGIVGLLHTPYAPSYLPHVQFDRDLDSTILSPVRGRRLSDVHARLQHADKTDSLCIVSQDHYLLAIQGLQDLVDSPSQWTDSVFSTRGTLSPTEELSGAVLILPLINDYLSHYIEMLSNTSGSLSPSSGTTNSSSLGKGSISESSLESVTSSMGQLIKDCQTFANNLEYLSLASLRTLLTLVRFSAAVRRSLIDRRDWNHNRTDPLRVSMDSSASGEAAMETEGEVSTSSSSMDTMSLESRVPFQQLQEMNMLQKIATLAHPQQENCSIVIVEEAWNIILVLACKWDERDHIRLHSALSHGALTRCLECKLGENPWGIITRAVTVLAHLARSHKVVEVLCTKSDTCPLLHLYLLSLKLTDEVDWNIRETIYGQTIICLSHLLTEPGNSMSVMTSVCHCSAEAGRSVVTCLLNLYQHYEYGGDHPAHVLQCLHSGLLLLHHCQQRYDKFLMDRDCELQDEYVTLVCGLTSVIKQLPGSQEAELTALSDLWDFNQDDSELSPDSDQEEMDL